MVEGESLIRTLRTPRFFGDYILCTHGSSMVKWASYQSKIAFNNKGMCLATPAIDDIVHDILDLQLPDYLQVKSSDNE